MRRFGFYCLLCGGLAQAQVITTVAGTDPVFPASGTVAVNAALKDLWGVAADTTGNFYFVDESLGVVAKVSPTGVLTIVAGNGHAGFSGDGGPATSASLNSPTGLALDSAGNLYIADTINYRIRKVSGGVITTVAGTGTRGFSGDGGEATSASLNFPTGLAVDASGNLYIADTDNQRVRRVSGGIITTIAGNGSSGYSGDGGPATSASLGWLNANFRGLAVDGAGNLYIADTENARIRKVSGGTITTVAGNGSDGFSGDGGPATAASLSQPYAMAFDPAGNLFFTDAERIRKISSGVITTIAGTGSSGFAGDGGQAAGAALNLPVGIAADSTGNVYFADHGNQRIRKISAGTISTVAGTSSGASIGDGGPAINALLNYPNGVAVDSAGNLYISDTFNQRVRKVSGGTITTVAGNGIIGYTPTAIDYPLGLAVDAAGSLYIANEVNNTILKLSGSALSVVAGNGSWGFSGDGGQANNAQIANPYGVAVDTAGNLYIADTMNNRVRKVSGGIITTVAGNGTAKFSGDGGPATAASLNLPNGIAVDSGGNLYIADTNNQRVRKVSGGTITTVAGNGTAGSAIDNGPATSSPFRSPVAVAVDSAGNLYIADAFNCRVRKVSAGTITTVAGSGFCGLTGDGGPALSASFEYPVGLAFDTAGNLYVVESYDSRVREVLSLPASYTVAPSSLAFSAISGGNPPGTQAITLSAAVSGLTFSASTNAAWLTIAPASGTFPTTLQVTADPSALVAGSYQASIILGVPNAAPAITTIPVTFTVLAAKAPALAAAPASISFAATQAGGALTQQVQVSNTGSGSLSFTASAATTSGGAWLSVSPTSGTATPAAPAQLTITATPGSLAAGTYNGTVTVTGAASSINIPVTLSVTASTAIILLSQSALSFTAVAQGGVPLAQNFGILNIGQGSLSWTASATTISGGNWLQISPTSGTVTRPYLDVAMVTVSIDPTTLGAGTYYGRIRVSASAVNTPQLMTVILTVLPAGLSLPPQVFPSGLIFTGVAGVTPGSQDAMVANPGGQTESFLSGLIGSGFSFLPTNATVQSNQPTAVHVYPDYSNLNAGSINRGTITLQFSDGSPAQTINVLMMVAPAAGSSGAEVAGALEPRASGCTAQAWSIQFRSLQPGFAAVLGQATAVDVQVADGCGNLVGPNGQSAWVAANVSNGDPLFQLTHVGNGIWQGTWKPAATGSGVTLFVTALGPSGVGGQNKISGAVSAPAPAAATPLVTAQGVVHAASDQAGVPIAPGGLITVYGANLSDAAGGSNSIPLPEQLNGTQVLLGDQPLPILYTSTGQLNVQVPYGVPVNTQYQMTVQHGNTLSVPQSLVVAPAQPGIFTVNQQGNGQGSIVKSDQITLAQPGTPANIGETIVIYCTGLGAVTPAVKEGQPAPALPPFSQTVNPVTVTIGGQPAQLIFSGLTPGFAGLYQVNAVVPPGITTGDAVPVQLSVAGQTSPPVTIAVR